MKREFLISLLVIEYSIKELNPLSDKELMVMWEVLRAKMDGDW